MFINTLDKFDYVRSNRTQRKWVYMISFGIVLLVVSLLTGIIVLKSLGLLLVIVGVVLVLLAGTGRAIGGRKHYW